MTALAACQREQRTLRPPPYQATVAPQPVRLVPLQPGIALPAQRSSVAYDNSAYAIAEGQRLFSAYNCSGCHANGGGGMGPALIDSVWIYGSDPANIHATIVQGRPNGMPSFGGHIPDQQVWQLVAYVRALGGLEPSTRVPPRTDHMQSRTPGEATP
ncbi:MAG: c-type cytochrome [Gemmatimonadetes bacterium]|nr:c-type cytochrome [Gemmatimonadota bacterium]